MNDKKTNETNNDNGNKKSSGFWDVVRHALFPILAVVCIAGYFIYTAVSGNSITVENLFEHTPQSALPAALMLILFYVLKSLSVFFPVTVLYAVGGYLFGPVAGCIINLLGIAAGCAVQYGMGHSSGQNAAEKLRKKYPRVEMMMNAQDRSPIISAFWARLIGMLSGDIISYYFGASGVKFGYFMLGSLLGVLPGLISVTVLGTSVSDPSSPLFIVSVVLIVAFFLLSLAGRAIYNKINARKNKKSEALDEGNTDDGGKLQ